MSDLLILAPEKKAFLVTHPRVSAGLVFGVVGALTATPIALFFSWALPLASIFFAGLAAAIAGLALGKRFSPSMDATNAAGRSVALGPNPRSSAFIEGIFTTVLAQTLFAAALTVCAFLYAAGTGDAVFNELLMSILIGNIVVSIITLPVGGLTGHFLYRYRLNPPKPRGAQILGCGSHLPVPKEVQSVD